MSISVRDMQKLIDLCTLTLSECDLTVNNLKTTCLRIGQRFSHTSCELFMNNCKLCWKSEMKYLGVCILSGKKFTCNLQLVRQKFYRAVSGVFGKIFCTQNPTLILSVINSFCVPILLYGLEAVHLNVSSMKSIDFMYNSVFAKVFKTSDNNTISQCQYYTRHLPISCVLDLKIMNFLSALPLLSNSLPLIISKLSNMCDVSDIARRYAINSDLLMHCGKDVRKRLMWSWFEEKQATLAKIYLNKIICCID